MWFLRRVAGAATAASGADSLTESTLTESTEGEKILTTGAGTAVVTPLNGAHELVTTLDPAGVVTRGAFGRVAGNAQSGEQRLDVQLASDDHTTFTLTHNDVRIGDAASVAFQDNRILVCTALLTTERDDAGVRIRRTSEDGLASGVFHDFGSGTVRTAVDGKHQLIAQTAPEGMTVSVADDVAVRVTRNDRAEVRLTASSTTFALDPDTSGIVLVSADGQAEVTPTAGLKVTCARTGWKVSADTHSVAVELPGQPGVGLRWHSTTGTLHAAACAHLTLEVSPYCSVARACADCGTRLDARRHGTDLILALPNLTLRGSRSGLKIEFGDNVLVMVANGRVRVSWSGKDFVVDRGRVHVGGGTEDWYVTPDGRLVTGASVVSTGRTVDGVLEVVVQSNDHDWAASVWARGACVDNGNGLRAVLDDAGAVVCTSASRADSAVIVHDAGGVLVRSAAVTVELDRAGAVRLRESGVAELTVHPNHADEQLRSTITCDEQFSVTVTHSAVDGFAWTTTHLDTQISHSVRPPGELDVLNSPSGTRITATISEILVIEANEHRDDHPQVPPTGSG
ncbi:hypothetical protein GCM10010178_79790 [Lentzea flava]|uniref:Adhesin n=1 Tax=Lentzea flava TaxID=103732 RepID=A0ABQ2VAQ6_9PSEU|nr:hypothetical protein [Lentzea flava]GGU76650.1 hypothetical protein GCM10010178_79790 [Lentzea flava]